MSEEVRVNEIARGDRSVSDQRLLFRNTMRINAGGLDQYREAIRRAVNFAERFGPQVMVDVFIDEPAMRAHSFQLYANSAAVLRHWELSDPFIRDVMEHCIVERFEVFGQPDERVAAGLAASDIEVTFVPRLTGFLRDGDDVSPDVPTDGANEDESVASEAAPPAVKKFTIATATEWMTWSGTQLADVANEDDAPDMKLGAIGFTRAPAGATSSFQFPYDEVLVVTKGLCTVSDGDLGHSAGPGEVVYLPANRPGRFRADEDVELVYVASSPYGEVNRQAKAELLAQPAVGKRGRW